MFSDRARLRAVTRAGPWLLVLGSAFTAPLPAMARLTLTGDRALGLLALGAAVGLAVARRLQWTPIHSALALFVGVQLATTAVNAGSWPAGLKFVTVYLLGFACFCLAAEVASRRDGRTAFVTAWIAVGAALGAIGTVLAVSANLSQTPSWGTEVVQTLAPDAGPARVVFAGQVTFRERNLLSSFLLVPFALALWQWRSVVGLAAVVLGLSFGFTRAAWISMAGIVAAWCWLERPPWRRLAAVGAMVLAAFLLQAAVVGASAIEFRMIDPLAQGYDRNVAGRLEISRLTIASWLTRPLVGRGAGSINALSIVRPSGKRIGNLWNGNLVLFVLHDSGLAGLGALAWLGAVVWRQARRARRQTAQAETSPLVAPLLAAGAALCFSYQFTHGLWLMYPYVYLGLLAGVVDDTSATG